MKALQNLVIVKHSIPMLKIFATGFEKKNDCKIYQRQAKTAARARAKVMRG